MESHKCVLAKHTKYLFILIKSHDLNRTSEDSHFRLFQQRYPFNGSRNGHS